MVLEEYTTDIKPVNGMFAATPYEAESIVSGLHVPARISEHIVKVESGYWEGEYAIVSKFGKVWFDAKGGLLHESGVYAYTDLKDLIQAVEGGIIAEIEEQPETVNGIYLPEITKDQARANGKIDPVIAHVRSANHVDGIDCGMKILLRPKEGLRMTHYDLPLIPKGKTWVFLKPEYQGKREVNISEVVLGVLE